jgi:hypothetical protein
MHDAARSVSNSLAWEHAMNLFFRILAVLLLEITLGLGYAFADCTRDRNGLVFCSQHPGGGAVRDNSGQVVCGNGKIDLVPELEKIRCPVLVVVPGADPILRWTNTG